MPIYAWDVRWLLWVNQSAHGGLLGWVMIQIAQYGYLAWLLLLIVILFLDRQRGKLVFLTGITAWGFSSYLGDTLLRPAARHARPGNVPDLAPQLHILVPMPSFYSFPSSAATFSFAVAAVIAYFYRGWKRWAALLAAAVIAYSRVYVGVHFPSDVIGGAMIGLLVGFGGTALEGRWWRQSAAPRRPNAPAK
ncbi:MAG: phosphatase PAP2 family protein [Acidobacteria bacterium]|nr:phosphatase PAP2 family protein [Acidobacteriota bacterium]